MAIKFEIEKESENVRIDKFLSEELPDMSRSYIQKLIKEGQVVVNDTPVKANYKLSLGDLLTLEEPEL